MFTWRRGRDSMGLDDHLALQDFGGLFYLKRVS
jgi:hypothetical protein